MKSDGLDIFYIEAGPEDAAAVLPLHGLPAGSHMFRNLIPEPRNLPGGFPAVPARPVGGQIWKGGTLMEIIAGHGSGEQPAHEETDRKEKSDDDT